MSVPQKCGEARALMLWVYGLNVEEVEELDGDQVADVC